MPEEDRIFTTAQRWIVHLKEEGKVLLQDLTGSSILSDMLFVVDLPEDTNRSSEKQLVEDIRHRGALEIFRKCQKYGLKVSQQDVLKLADHKFMEGGRPSSD
jgi:hypothetical protein